MEKQNEKNAKLYMEACRENKNRLKLEDEKTVSRQKIAMLEKELKEQFSCRTRIEELCRKEGELRASLTSEIEEKAKVVKELKTMDQRGTAKLEDLKNEVEHEKKLTEEWKERCIKNERQKSITDQVDVISHLLTDRNT